MHVVLNYDDSNRFRFELSVIANAPEVLRVIEHAVFLLLGVRPRNVHDEVQVPVIRTRIEEDVQVHVHIAIDQKLAKKATSVRLCPNMLELPQSSMQLALPVIREMF